MKLSTTLLAFAICAAQLSVATPAPAQELANAPEALAAGHAFNADLQAKPAPPAAKEEEEEDDEDDDENEPSSKLPEATRFTAIAIRPTPIVDKPYLPPVVIAPPPTPTKLVQPPTCTNPGWAAADAKATKLEEIAKKARERLTFTRFASNEAREAAEKKVERQEAAAKAARARANHICSKKTPRPKPSKVIYPKPSRIVDPPDVPPVVQPPPKPSKGIDPIEVVDPRPTKIVDPPDVPPVVQPPPTEYDCNNPKWAALDAAASELEEIARKARERLTFSRFASAEALAAATAEVEKQEATAKAARAKADALCSATPPRPKPSKVVKPPQSKPYTEPTKIVDPPSKEVYPEPSKIIDPPPPKPTVVKTCSNPRWPAIEARAVKLEQDAKQARERLTFSRFASAEALAAATKEVEEKEAKAKAARAKADAACNWKPHPKPTKIVDPPTEPSKVVDPPPKEVYPEPSKIVDPPPPVKVCKNPKWPAVDARAVKLEEIARKARERLSLSRFASPEAFAAALKDVEAKEAQAKAARARASAACNWKPRPKPTKVVDPPREPSKVVDPPPTEVYPEPSKIVDPPPPKPTQVKTCKNPKWTAADARATELEETAKKARQRLTFSRFASAQAFAAATKKVEDLEAAAKTARAKANAICNKRPHVQPSKVVDPPKEPSKVVDPPPKEVYPEPSKIVDPPPPKPTSVKVCKNPEWAAADARATELEAAAKKARERLSFSRFASAEALAAATKEVEALEAAAAAARSKANASCNTKPRPRPTKIVDPPPKPTLIIDPPPPPQPTKVVPQPTCPTLAQIKEARDLQAHADRLAGAVAAAKKRLQALREANAKASADANYVYVTLSPYRVIKGAKRELKKLEAAAKKAADAAKVARPRPGCASHNPKPLPDTNKKCSAEGLSARLEAFAALKRLEALRLASALSPYHHLITGAEKDFKKKDRAAKKLGC
ncbi:hypothetical protein HGRIS_005371 [Hohenbuehelia grisea]|uniref:Uncharacterized protein n=1 Tax=Hohenbuehelia grisea TaxID=104357 RepID=A0ABR3JES5_9AGAR